MSSYRTLAVRFWTDEKIRALSLAERLVALYCLTGPQTTMTGLFLFRPTLAADDLGLPVKAFLTIFEAVCGRLGWRWDRVARVLYLPRWFRYNAPGTYKQVQGIVRRLRELPDTFLLSAYRDSIRAQNPADDEPLALLGSMMDRDLAEPLERSASMGSEWDSGGVPNGIPDAIPMGLDIQEQEQEQEQGTRTGTENSAKAKDAFALSDARGRARARSTPVVDPDFDAFWSAYPRKEGKGDARKAWAQVAHRRPPVDELIAAIEQAKGGDQWARALRAGELRFIPHPATWLRQERWDDSPPPFRPQPGGTLGAPGSLLDLDDERTAELTEARRVDL